VIGTTAHQAHGGAGNKAAGITSPRLDFRARYRVLSRLRGLFRPQKLREFQQDSFRIVRAYESPWPASN
jgi:hypothetical protein